MAEIYSLSIMVTSNVIDERNHVNNLAYLQWCMDVAQKHWIKKASKKLQNEYVWYVLNHTISYKASAYDGDKLLVETWVSMAEGVRSSQKFRITRQDDAKLLVEAETLWCLLSRKSLKPAKINKEIRTLFL